MTFYGISGDILVTFAIICYYIDDDMAMSNEHKERDEKEFVDELVAHQSLIQAFVVSLMPGFSETDDIVQNVNQVLWIKRDTFERGTNFKAWALTIARFQVMAMQQTLKRSKLVCLDDSALDAVAVEAEGRDPADSKRKLNYLNECIRLLSIKDQELVLHRYWKKSNLEAYGKSTKRSVEALRSALYRIRSGLRKCVEQKILLNRDINS